MARRAESHSRGTTVRYEQMIPSSFIGGCVYRRPDTTSSLNQLSVWLRYHVVRLRPWQLEWYR